MIRAVLVDDEEMGRNGLRELLKRFCPAVEIIGEADSVQSAIQIIKSNEPDLVFLDVLLSPGDGFQVLDNFPNPGFELIFTTAYNQYGIQAIRHAALDYLLKPINPVELLEAVTKAEQKLSEKDTELSGKRLLLPSVSGFINVSKEEIIRFEANGKKVLVIIKNHPQVEIDKSLAELEEILVKDNFFRTHRTHLINLDEVKEYAPSSVDTPVLMSDGVSIPLAMRRKEEFGILFQKRQ